MSLVSLLANRPVTLKAVTVDHGLRAGAADEARHVAGLCANLGVSHSVLRWTGEKPATGIQNAARLARYRLLREAMAGIAGPVAIVTGHTRDDQFETVAMRHKRSGTDGAEAGGMAGMAEATLFSRDCWILRPLLSVSRTDLRQYLKRRGIGWIDDPSNDDPRFERVRIRREGASGHIHIDAITDAARRRTARSDAIARTITRHGGSWRGLLFWMDGTTDEGHDAAILRDAVCELALLAGGLSRRPGRDRLHRMNEVLDLDGRQNPDRKHPSRKRMTLARSLIERDAGVLWIHRERRFLPRLSLAPGERGTWDGRFEIVNRSSDRPLIVEPACENGAPFEGAEEAGATGPRGTVIRARLLRAAAAAAPAFRTLQGDEAQDVHWASIIARHDTFLPVFDWKLANAVAGLVGRADYPLSPLRPERQP